MYRYLFIFLFVFTCEIALAKGDDVDTLLHRIFTYAERIEGSPKDFEARTYARFKVESDRKNVFMKLVPKINRLPKGENTIYGESAADFHFSKENGIDVKVRGYFSTKSSLPKADGSVLRRFSVAFYEPTFFSDRILSPLNKKNHKFYNYRICMIGDTIDGGLVCVDVSPRFENAQLVTGKFIADYFTGEVQSVNFRFHYDVMEINVSGTVSQESENRFFPDWMRVQMDFNLLRNKLTATHEAYIRYDLSKESFRRDSVRRTPKHYDLTDRLSLRCDSAIIRNDRFYFDSIRPLPLNPEHYVAYDSMFIEKEKIDDDTTRKVLTFLPATERILLDNRAITIGKNGHFVLPAIITPSMVEWSKSKGFSLQTKFKLKWDFRKDKGLSVDPKVGYNFKKKYLYWDVPLNVNIFPERDVELRLAVGNGNRIYNSDQTDRFLEENKNTASYDTLVNYIKKFDFNYYKDLYIKGRLGFQPIVGLKLWTEARFHLRTMEEWNDFSNTNNMQHYVRSFAPSVHIEWTPCVYYYRIGRKREAIRTKYPTLAIDYERGLQVARCDSKYEKIEFSAYYKWKLYALRALYFRFGAGGYTQRSRAYFVDYEYFKYNNLPEGWDDESAREFQLLDADFYNASNYYVKCSAVYESPMLLFSRIPYVTRLVQKERIFVNMLYSQVVKPYTEFGYGISTHIIDFGAFVSVARGNSLGIGCKVSLSLFEDW